MDWVSSGEPTSGAFVMRGSRAGSRNCAATPSTVHCGQRTGTVNRCVVATPADVLVSIDQAGA
jgi:hypothetical protein